MWPDERVVRFVNQHFLPARVHVKDDAAEFKRYGERYNARWTPTILELDAEGVERHRVEGFLPADDLLAQLTLGLGRSASRNWSHCRPVTNSPIGLPASIMRLTGGLPSVGWSVEMTG